MNRQPAYRQVPWHPDIARQRLRRSGLALLCGVATSFAACAQFEPSRAPSEAPASHPSDSSRQSLPQVELTGEILYKLLASEIAAQRNEPLRAFATEFELAKQTRDPRIAKRAVEFAVLARQPQAALSAARLWNELSPNARDANDTYVTLLILAGRLDEAEPLLAARIASSPSRSQAIAQVHGILAQSPNRPAAYALIQKLAGAYPALPEAHLVVAQAAQNAGDKQKAIEEARVASRLKPDWDAPVIMLAQYQQFDAPKEAEAALAGFLSHNPKSVPVRMAYARFLIGERRYDDASGQFARIQKERPDNAETAYALGLLAYQATKPVEAETYFTRFLDLRAKQTATADALRAKQSSAADPDADDESDEALDLATGGRGPEAAYLYLAQIAEDAKDYPRALNWLAKVGEGNAYTTARIRRALILSHQGQLDEARAELHALPATTPAARAQVTLAEAQLLREAGQNQAAFDLLGVAIEKTPNNPELLYDYGMTAEKLGRLDVLESAMRTVIKVRPDYAQAYNALGYTLADRNQRLDEAKALIEKANALAPDDASILDSLGWVQYRLGNNRDAIDQLQHAYKLRADAEIAVHLGEVLWVSGRRAEAESFWKEANVKDPQNVVLQQTLTRFNVQIGKR